LISVAITVAKKDGKRKTAEDKPRETIVESLSSLAAGLVKIFFVITFVVHAFEIPSSSMENTLLIGDHVLVDRIQFAPRTSWMRALLPYREVRRGDIVVFLAPCEPGLHVVKRVIGEPGDRIHLRNGVVYRNGKPLQETYVIHSESSYPNAYRDDFPAVPTSESANVYPCWKHELAKHVEGEDLVVPPGHYFAMGDNRDVSLDSRYWGFIPQENLIGRPMFVYWSFETPDGQYLKTGMADRLGFLAHVVLHFFDETRWGRTLEVVR
jgi:signal peptidase I